MLLESLCSERGIGGIISKQNNFKQIIRVVSTVIQGISHNLIQVDKLNGEESKRANLHNQMATFTPKEIQVFAHIGKGYLNKQIAHELEISEATIKFHVGNIFRKLGCQNRTQVAVIANRHVFFS